MWRNMAMEALDVPAGRDQCPMDRAASMPVMVTRPSFAVVKTAMKLKGRQLATCRSALSEPHVQPHPPPACPVPSCAVGKDLKTSSQAKMLCHARIHPGLVPMKLEQGAWHACASGIDCRLS